MKRFTKLFTAVLAVGLAASASATDYYVYITGSSAYRATTHQAILKYCGATGADASSSPATGGTFASLVYGSGAGQSTTSAGKYGYVGSDWGGAKSATFITKTPVTPPTGWVAGSDRLIIKTLWSGSEAGIQAVAASSVTAPATLPTVPFLSANFDTDADTTLTVGGASGRTDPTTTSATASTETHTGADVAMADSWQESSVFKSGATVPNVTTGGSVTYAGLTEAIVTAPSTRGPVGIAPFIFCLQRGGPAAITNICNDTVKAIYSSSGYTSAQILTGNNADASTRIYGIGRDIDSGTRVVTLAVTGLGINNGVKQWRPNLPQGSTAVTAYNSPNATGAVPAGNTYSYDNTSNTITLTTAAATLANQGIYTGMAVSGTSIPGNSIVGSLTNSTQFKIISNQTSLAAVPTPGSPIVNGSLTIGLSGAASLKQGITNSLTTGLAWSLVPIQVINGVSTGSFGNGGEASGGTIANFLKATSATTNGYCVGYISTGDAVSALKAAPGAGATPLSYEGVNIVSSYSAAAVTYDFTPIRNGTYKHWSYEHMFYNAGTLPTAQQNVANSIAQQIAGTDAALTNQCANDASIKVKRTGTHIDGSTVTPSFTNF